MQKTADGPCPASKILSNLVDITLEKKRIPDDSTIKHALKEGYAKMDSNTFPCMNAFCSIVTYKLKRISKKFMERKFVKKTAAPSNNQEVDGISDNIMERDPFLPSKKKVPATNGVKHLLNRLSDKCDKVVASIKY